MRITPEQLVDVVEGMFEETEPQIADNGAVIVAVTFDQYSADIYMTLDDKYDPIHNKPEQMLDIMYVFVDDQGHPLNFHHKSLAEVEILCGALNKNTRWSKVASTKLPNRLTTIGLWRSINITEEGLQRAADDDPECELCTALEALEAEYAMAADIVASFLRGDVKADQHLVQLIEGSEAVVH